MSAQIDEDMDFPVFKEGNMREFCGGKGFRKDWREGRSTYCVF